MTAMEDLTIKDKVAIVGIGETDYYKRGGAPVSEFQLTLDAILKAVDDAGLDVSQIDGFASYSNDRNDPNRLATALGVPELSFSNMFWGGGGGGGSGAVGNAAAAIVAGYSKYVVVYRGLAQGQFGRFGQGSQAPAVAYPGSYTVPYGLMSRRSPSRCGCGASCTITTSARTRWQRSRSLPITMPSPTRAP
ncbi:MAG: hypothetical protein AB7U18_08825 [Dehalococcoidia bacterium]